MSKYQLAYQCDMCKKVYSKDKFIWTNNLYLYGICPKCGSKGRIHKIIARPKLFGLKGWEVKEEDEKTNPKTDV